MFDADRPILKSEQDRLGRSIFGKYLARCILDHASPESLVIGLYGGWGTGKTSIIHLTLEELGFASWHMFDNQKPIILNFSPWSYSGQNDLIYSFFRRLSSEMRSADYFENKDHIIHLLELYVSFFTHKPVPKVLRPKHFWLTKWFKPQRSLEESFGWESGRDLTQVKAELNELLGKQQHKIIIFIDNIARLQDNEINKIFQIVKSIGDFSNTVYVLAMDKNIVIKAINKTHEKGEGIEYLEKLIQLPFEIPPISKQDIETIFLDRCSQVIRIVPEDSWDSVYWAEIYYSTLKFFFETCRDITRYINTLSFSYIHVKEVVNPVDFFAMTAVEVFEPNVFFGIRDNKDLFIDLVENVYILDAEKLTEDRGRCDEILARAERIPREILKQLLIRLFPRLRSIYEATIPFYHSESVARRNKRICSFDVFEIYFRLTLGTTSFSDLEMKAILALTHDEAGFALALLRLNQDDRILKFLDALDSAGVNKIPTSDIQNVINALLDSADLFPQGESTPLSFDTPSRLHRIFHQLLRRFENNEKRFQIFSKAIIQSINSLYIIVHELTEQGREHIENEDTYVPLVERDFSAEQLNSLRKMAVDKIIHWADRDRLVEHPQLLPILYAWKMWGDEEQCKRYVEHIVQSDRGLLAFLYAVLKEPVTEAMTEEESNPEWNNYRSRIEDFIPADKLLFHARELFQDDYFVKLRETEQLTLLIFLDMVRPNTRKIFPKTTV